MTYCRVPPAVTRQHRPAGPGVSPARRGPVHSAVRNHENGSCFTGCLNPAGHAGIDQNQSHLACDQQGRCLHAVVCQTTVVQMLDDRGRLPAYVDHFIPRERSSHQGHERSGHAAGTERNSGNEPGCNADLAVNLTRQQQVRNAFVPVRTKQISISSPCRPKPFTRRDLSRKQQYAAPSACNRPWNSA